MAACRQMVLVKELRVLHLNLQAAEGNCVTLARLELIRPQSLAPQWDTSSNKARLLKVPLPMGKALTHWAMYGGHPYSNHHREKPQLLFLMWHPPFFFLSFFPPHPFLSWDSISQWPGTHWTVWAGWRLKPRDSPPLPVLEVQPHHLLFLHCNWSLQPPRYSFDQHVSWG